MNMGRRTCSPWATDMGRRLDNGLFDLAAEAGLETEST